MSERAEEEVKVEGATATIKTCDHCGRTPTREDVVVAVKRAQEHRACTRYRCGYCGKPIKATKYYIYHDSHGWSAQEQTIEPSISINQMYTSEGPPIHDHNGLHMGCVSKSMPFINGLTTRM